MQTNDERTVQQAQGIMLSLSTKCVCCINANKLNNIHTVYHDSKTTTALAFGYKVNIEAEGVQAM